MCLSPEVDLAAAAFVGVVAVDTLRRNRNPDAVLLAIIPAIFAVHNLASALMWWHLRGEMPAALGITATRFYEFVAFCLWPIYVPIAVRAMETLPWRRSALGVVGLGGLIVAGFHFAHLVTGQIVAVEHSEYVAFEYPTLPVAVGLLYGVATCGALLLSSHRELVGWAAVNAAAIIVLALRAAHGLPSLWCLWAAVTSVFLNWFIRGHRLPRRAG